MGQLQVQVSLGILIFRNIFTRKETYILHDACESSEPKAKHFACRNSEGNTWWGNAPPHLRTLFIKRKLCDEENKDDS